MPRPIRDPYRIPWGAHFGAPRSGGSRIHEGTDYHAPIGTPIYGTGSNGVVVRKGVNLDPKLGMGYSIRVQYPNGRLTLDGHMQGPSPLAVGASVGSNTVIGRVGLTGNAVIADPPGPHVHHQMWINGKLADPEAFYQIESAGSGGTPIPKRRRRMSTLYTVKKAPGTNDERWAVAGDFGNPWVETQRPSLGKSMVAQYGPAIELDSTAWANVKAGYQADRFDYDRLASALLGSTGAPPVSGLNEAVAQIINAIPSADDNGRAARSHIVK